MSSLETNDLIRLDNVSMIREGRTILQDVNFRVHQNDFVAITGPNGGGKTTLLRIILQLIKPTHGTVSIKPGISIGYLPQKNAIDSHFPISVQEVVASGILAESSLSKQQVRQRVADTLTAVQLSSNASQPIGQLSGGQLQRALLGRAIISSPQLLVLDEPLSYIDKHFEKHLYQLISILARTTTILLVSHEMSTIAAMANRHIIIDHTLHDCHASHHFVHTECDS